MFSIRKTAIATGCLIMLASVACADSDWLKGSADEKLKTRARAVRGVLSVGRAGVWRRPCRASSAASAGRCAEVGQQRGLPGGLWTCPGGSGPALHLCRLSWSGDGSRRRTARPVQPLPSSRCCFRGCCLSMACCRSGIRCGHARPLGPRCVAPMQPWSAFSGRQSIIRSGPARS